MTSITAALAHLIMPLVLAAPPPCPPGQSPAPRAPGATTTLVCSADPVGAEPTGVTASGDAGSDAARYAAMERRAPAAADFRGGGGVVIVLSTGAAIVAIVLLVLLL
ncbi:MAG: hypothetical protein U1F43_05395 [Myxococcota bacterium]